MIGRSTANEGTMSHPMPMSHPRRAVALLALLTLLVTPLPIAAQGARLATNLLTHNAIVIARPAAAVWPYIVDPSSWKQGNRLVHRSGPVGQVGEVFASVSASTPNDADYFVQNVELEPNRRRTIKLYGRDGGMIGFAAFTLEESSGRTTVSYDVFAETILPPSRAQETTPQALAESERVAREANARRFDAELATLKRLAEEK